MGCVKGEWMHMNRQGRMRRRFLCCMGKMTLCAATFACLPRFAWCAAAQENAKCVIGTAESANGLYRVRLTVAEERIMRIEPLTPATRTVEAHRRAVSDALLKLKG